MARITYITSDRYGHVLTEDERTNGEPLFKVVAVRSYVFTDDERAELSEDAAS